MLTTLRNDGRGASLAEYLIVGGAIALVAVAGYRAFGHALIAQAQHQAACIAVLSDCSRGEAVAGLASARTQHVVSGRDTSLPTAVSGAASASQDASSSGAASGSATGAAGSNSMSGRLPGAGLPRSTAELINRLWLDPRIATGSTPLPWATSRNADILTQIKGYAQRTNTVKRLYGDTFSPSDAANAEHFYVAADFSSTFPVVWPLAGHLDWHGEDVFIARQPTRTRRNHIRAIQFQSPRFRREAWDASTDVEDSAGRYSERPPARRVELRGAAARGRPRVVRCSTFGDCCGDYNDACSSQCGSHVCPPDTVGCNCACANAACVPKGSLCSAICL